MPSGHDPGVAPNLHVDPAVLRAVAVAVGGLLPALRVPRLDPADLDALARAPGGVALVAEHDRLVAAVARVGRDLVELVDGLGEVADGVGSAERHAVAAMTVAQR